MEEIFHYIKVKLGTDKLDYGRLSWIWSTGASGSLTMELDKNNSIAGILIMNFGVSIPGTGAAFTITDVKTSQIVYRSTNSVAGNIVAPFLWFSEGDNLSFLSSVNLVYGFNFITVRKAT